MDQNVKEVLMAPAILGSLGAAVYFFVKTMTDYILKKKMIEKGFVNDDTQAIFKTHSETNRYSSLKWGLIILFAGLSPFDVGRWCRKRNLHEQTSWQNKKVSPLQERAGLCGGARFAFYTGNASLVTSISKVQFDRRHISVSAERHRHSVQS